MLKLLSGLLPGDRKRKKEMKNKIDKLTAIFDACAIDFNPADYDFTLPDSADESDAGGVWNLAGDIVDCCLPTMWGDTTPDGIKRDQDRAALQSLLYNLLTAYKTEQGE